MGLDIRMVQGINYIGKTSDNDDDVHLYNNDDSCSQNVAQPGIYSIEQDDWVFGRAYSTYNHLRRQLAELVGKTTNQIWQDPKPGIPFVELINFSDCEGAFDTKCCIKLAQDFKSYEHLAAAHEDEQFREFYTTMQNAFVTAGNNNGAIIFS